MSVATTSKARPILMSAPMVNAIIGGRKTMTRRLVKPQPSGGFESFGELPTCDCHPFGFHDGERHYPCPYGKPGDMLWVRETAAINDNGQPSGLEHHFSADVRYKADDLTRVVDVHMESWRVAFENNAGRWTPAIHMPRWASRLTLRVEAVRVERLATITEADALAEGCDGNCPVGHIAAHAAGPCVYHFAQLWESIHGPGSWAANPCVWAVTFSLVEGGAK